MKIIARILITSLLVILISYLMKGVNVVSVWDAVIVAIVLGLLNLFVKPVLVILTLPVTIVTLGLFLLVINALLILLCAKLVHGFTVNSFWTALIFSIILSLSQSLMYKFIGESS